MTKETVKEKFAAVIFSLFGIGDAELLPEASFKDDLALDSLDRVELIMDLEREFQITIEDNEIDNAETVEKMLDIIHSKVKED